MQFAEKSFQRKECFAIVNDAVQKLLEQDFVMKVPSEELDHSQPEWYLSLQVVFTPERTTKVHLAFDASPKGHDGLSLNDHLVLMCLWPGDGMKWLTRVISEKCLIKS